MGASLTAFTSGKMTDQSVQRVMEHIGGQRDEHGWVVSRNGRKVFVELTSDEIPDYPDELIQPVADVLQAVPRSSVILMFENHNPDQFEARLARAIAMALSELWPIALDDHAGEIERIFPPGHQSNN